MTLFSAPLSTDNKTLVLVADTALQISLTDIESKFR